MKFSVYMTADPLPDMVESLGESTQTFIWMVGDQLADEGNLLGSCGDFGGTGLHSCMAKWRTCKLKRKQENGLGIIFGA